MGVCRVRLVAISTFQSLLYLYWLIFLYLEYDWLSVFFLNKTLHFWGWVAKFFGVYLLRVAPKFVFVKKPENLNIKCLEWVNFLCFSSICGIPGSGVAAMLWAQLLVLTEMFSNSNIAITLL